MARVSRVLEPTAMGRSNGSWSAEEDASLRRLVRRQGPRKWLQISKSIPRQSKKSSPLRRYDQLSPQVEHRPFTPEQVEAIVRARRSFSTKLAAVAHLFSGLNCNAIKNHWHSIRKRRCWTAATSELIVDAPPLHGPMPRSGDGGLSAFSAQDHYDTKPSTTLTLALPGRDTVGAAYHKRCEEAEEGRCHHPLPSEFLATVREMVTEEVESYLSSLNTA